MERKILGRPFTVSMFVTSRANAGPEGRHHRGPAPRRPLSSEISPARPGRTFRPTRGAAGIPASRDARLSETPGLFPEEIDLAFEEMARIKFEKSRLVLDPREPASASGPATDFLTSDDRPSAPCLVSYRRARRPGNPARRAGRGAASHRSLAGPEWVISRTKQFRVTGGAAWSAAPSPCSRRKPKTNCSA